VRGGVRLLEPPRPAYRGTSDGASNSHSSLVQVQTGAFERVGGFGLIKIHHAHTTGTASLNRRPPSVILSDEVSSDLSLDGSLSTPPAPDQEVFDPIYGPVRLPPAVPRAGRTAPASLPTQTPGTGRTNPVNLSPMQQPQQSQNPEGTPPPGAMNEPLAPVTTTSTRGRGTGNRGKKRR
jgi:hypothetical protein